MRKTDLFPKSGRPGEKALVVFMRLPEPGKVKSRLAAAVGPMEAAHVYERLVRRTLGVVADYKRNQTETEIFISFTPPDREDDMRRAFPGPWEFTPQENGSLGRRMESAVEGVRRLGFRQVVLIGSDLSDIEASDFSAAFQILDDGFAALGPAEDGGFYLIGLNRPCPEAFAPEDWGAGEIFARTERLLNHSGIKVRTPPVRRDVDSPEDLRFMHSDPTLRTRLSVIVPSVGPPRRAIELATALSPRLWPDDEILIVRGEKNSSGTGPAEPVDPNGRVRLLVSPIGRGIQLDAGAAAARGDIFLFLHVDSIPPADFAWSVRRIVLNPDASLGCFRLGFSPGGPILDAVASWANHRTRLFGLPYGDQGLFCRKETFRAVGGFRGLMLMEDVDFVRRCRKSGRLLMLDETTATSPERYLRKGIFANSLKNHFILLAYRLGADHRKLFDLYYRR